MYRIAQGPIYSNYTGLALVFFSRSFKCGVCLTDMGSNTLKCI